MSEVMDINSIERSIHINGSRDRVWRALTSAEEFGAWFGADLSGQSFIAGQRARGPMTMPGCEGLYFDAVIERIEPKDLLSFHWHPYSGEPSADYSSEEPTLVIFTLKDVPGKGVLLTVRAGISNCRTWHVMPATKAKTLAKAGGSAVQIAALNETLAPTFAALGDPTRLKLLAVLCEGGAYSISQLTETTDISRQGVTKHLNVLAGAGVVSDLKAGRERLWQLEVEKIDEARLALEAIGRDWEQALGRLKRFVEKDD